MGVGDDNFQTNLKERDTIPLNLRSLVPLQTWAWEL